MAKLRLFRHASSGEVGSAVAEFALLALPMSLLLVGAFNYCLNVFIDSALRFEAISVARFAALADVTVGDANERAVRVCASLNQGFSARCSVSYEASSFASVAFEYQPLSLVVFKPERVIIDAVVPLEIAK